MDLIFCCIMDIIIWIEPKGSLKRTPTNTCKMESVSIGKLRHFGSHWKVNSISLLRIYRSVVWNEISKRTSKFGQSDYSPLFMSKGPTLPAIKYIFISMTKTFLSSSFLMFHTFILLIQISNFCRHAFNITSI